MDESTFQQELIRLKDHIAGMAATWQSSPSASHSSRHRRDDFSLQLDDVKSTVYKLQTTLDSLNRMRSPPGSHQPLWHADQAGSVSVSSLLNPQDLTLPSGPLFWQLFTSLRTDVRGLDNRVAALEQVVSDLDDRVDKLEPPLLTPPGSERSSTSRGVWQEKPYATCASQPLVEDPIPYITELNFWKDGHNAHDQNFAPRQLHTAGSTDFLLQPVGSSHPCTAPEGVEFGDRGISQCRAWDFEKKHSELARLEARCTVRDSTLQELTSKSCAAQQKYLEKEDQIHFAERHIQRQKESISELHGRAKDEIERVTIKKDEEIHKLSRLVELKDATIFERDQVLARDADLIEEKCYEIERLSKELKSVRNDLNSEIQERSRIAKVAKEKDAEISQLRESLTRALMPRSISGEVEKGSQAPEATKGRVDIDQGIRPLQTTLSPFATAGTTGQTFGAWKWRPQAFDCYPLLPHERKRASAWENRSDDAAAMSKFGVPGTMVPLIPTDAANQTRLQAQKRDLRRSDEVKKSEQTAMIEAVKHRLKSGMTESAEKTTRRRLPLDAPLYPGSLLPHWMASDAASTPRSRADDELADS